jgi:hypothetical protein
MSETEHRIDSSNVAGPIWERIAIFAFGVVFITALLAFAVIYPQPTPFQYTVFRIVLALAGAGVAALIPGFIEVAYKKVIRAGGALGVFVVLYFFSPASLVATPPLSSRDVEVNVQYSLSDENLNRQVASKPDGWPPPDTFLASSTKLELLLTKKTSIKHAAIFASDLPHDRADLFLISRSVTSASMFDVSNDGGPGFSLNREYKSFTGDMGQFKDEKVWCSAKVFASIRFEPASGLDKWILPPHDVTRDRSFLTKYGLSVEKLNITSTIFKDYRLRSRLQLYLKGKKVSAIWGNVYMVHFGEGGFTPTLRLAVFEGTVDCQT